MPDPKVSHSDTERSSRTQAATSLTPNPDAGASSALALAMLPAWLQQDISEHHRAVCLDECAVGRELVTVQRMLSPGSLTGLDASEEAIVEARRRFPAFRFKVDAGEHGRAWDVLIHLDGPTAKARLLPALERLSTMARRAVVVVLPFGSLELEQLPLVVGGSFVLTHLSVTGEPQRWVVAVWALAELPAVQLLSVGQALSALGRHEPSNPQRATHLERVEADLARLRARLADASREGAGARQMLADKQLELEHLAREVDALRSQDAEVRLELSRMQASKSWQLTRPLREFTGSARKVTDQARDLVSLAQRVSSDVAKGKAREWLTLAREKETRTTPQPRTAQSALTSSPGAALFEPTIFMFALVPFDDVGGGQRSAQLARVLAARGYRVTYVYLYKKWSMTTASEEESHVDLPLLTHLHISQVDPATLLRGASPHSVAIFEAPHPRYTPFFDRAQQIGLRTVFELIDAWDTSLGGDWFSKDLMQRFATESEVAVGTARALVSQLETYGRREVRYLPNAGNEAIFDVTRRFERPSEMDASRKALVYVGSLYGEWFGWDYIRAAARACTSATFYLIGDPPRGLELPPNVKLLGARRIDEVPAYLAHADAALIPFIPGKISDAVSPIKIFEYLMMGKTVVSTDLPEIRGYPNVSIGDSVEAFAQACRTVEPPARAPETFTMRHTWSARADQILAAPQLPRLSLVIQAGASLFDAERCLEALSLHGSPHVEKVVLLTAAGEVARAEALKRHWPELVIVPHEAQTIGEAWLAARGEVSTELVGFLDDSIWFTSRACFEEAIQLFTREASLGVLGVHARFLDPDSGQPKLARADWLNDQRAAAGFRREIAYVSPKGLFIRRRLLDRVLGSPLETGELEGADLSFRVKAAGFDVGARALTGLQLPPEELEPTIRLDRVEPFLERWKTSRHFFVSRRGV